MKLDIWQVQGSSFHFGRRGLGQEESGVTFPSDSLFAALVARIAVLNGSKAVEEFCAPFAEDQPPFLLTTVYPRAGSVLFFPNPALQNLKDREQGPRPKDLKQVRFLSEGVFRRVIAGEALVDLWSELGKLHDNRVLYLPDEKDNFPNYLQNMEEDEIKLWDIMRRPRVAVERQTSASQIYHTGQTVFNEGCGLWFGMQWLEKEEALSAQVEQALEDLGYAGLGGERSSGFGACEIQKVNQLDFPDNDQGLAVTLSRYLPKEKEMSLFRGEHASYTLESVGGWIGSEKGTAQRRRRVTFVAEGSVLSVENGGALGQMVDVQPRYDGKEPMPHPVWRSGFTVAVGLENDGERE